MAGSGSAQLRDPNAALLRVENLVMEFPVGRGRKVSAVANLSFDLQRGETLGLVGESGCGKSTTGKAIMQLPRPTKGSVRLGDTELTGLKASELRATRPRMQMIFQDPISSLNPRRTVADIVEEPLRIWRLGDAAARREKVREVLDAVGINFEVAAERKPHEFSGGQCQRISIARALVTEPELIICDEPVSALDVSVQAQILNLLKDLQRDLGLTYLFISHNLAVVRYVAQKVGVMCRGRMVEVASTQKLFAAPHHPYTKALLAAVPEPDLDNLLDFERIAREQNNTPSDWPSPFALSTGSGRMVEIDRDHLVRMQA